MKWAKKAYVVSAEKENSLEVVGRKRYSVMIASEKRLLKTNQKV
jgi:hypothetical protein